MSTRVLLPWLSLALAALLPSTTAEECHRDYTLESGLGADDFTDCTTIIGNIDLGESYWNEVLFPNTVNITGTITIRDLGPDNACCHSWTEGISAPLLEHLGGLVIDNTSSGDVSLPKLKSIGQIHISLLDCDWPDLQFPSLVEADSINISRSFRSLNLESLRTVRDGLEVDYLSYTGKMFERGSVCREPSARSIALPALESAGFLSLGGILANISLPELKSIGPPASPASESGLRLHLAHAESALNLTLPKLEAIDSQLYVHGKIKRLRMPALLNTTASIHIDASESENLRIAWPIESASSIDLRGFIEYAWLYGITRFKSISVSSKTWFDCEKFERSLQAVQSMYRDNGPITCSSNPRKNNNLALKLALGIAIPLSVIASLVIFFCVKRNAKKQKKAPVLAGGGTELTTVSALEREREREMADDVGVQRPRTPPPPYSAT
ncbi:uncharacterized protein BDV17DRAFT_254919 [Aspergillus undulatus]|uniref:uncharacterized protein n=1 Tax=Aspergillus undulatus TaxID=1810928 RepID=UPI003CCD1006